MNEAIQRRERNLIAPANLRASANNAPVPLPSFIPQFDGLRAIAVLGVILYHAAVYCIPLRLEWATRYGWSGVDLFFVLSGFLITGILLETKDSPGYFKTFYIRRALRIWPLYYAFLLAMFLLAPLLQPELRHEFGTFRWYYYALYIQNLVFPNEFPFSVTWSLAVEEQFYMLFPLLVWLLSRKALRNLLIAIFLLSPLARLLGYWAGISWLGLYFHTPFRLHGLALGALAAIWVRDPGCTLRRWRRAAWACFAAGLPLSLWWLVRAGVDGEHSIMVYTWLSLLYAGVLGLALISAPSRGFGGLLTWSPIRYVGKISYGVYLLHQPLIGIFVLLAARWAWLQRANPVLRSVIALPLLLGFIVAGASLSWYGFERPILHLKRRFAYRKQAGAEAATDAVPGNKTSALPLATSGS